jgi:hypothetical protein
MSAHLIAASVAAALVTALPSDSASMLQTARSSGAARKPHFQSDVRRLYYARHRARAASHRHSTAGPISTTAISCPIWTDWRMHSASLLPTSGDAGNRRTTCGPGSLSAHV